MAAQNSTESSGLAGVDITIGVLTILYAIITIIGNGLIVQVIKNELRKCVMDFIFAQISLAHIFGGCTAFLYALLLISGREIFEWSLVDEVVCWIGGFVWHLVVLITPVLLVLVVLGRVIMQFSPLRYETIFTTKTVTAASVTSWVFASGMLAPFLYKGLNVLVLKSWGYPHYEVSTRSLDRYLMIFCFAGPLLLLQLILVLLILSVIVGLRLFKREEKKKEQKGFIQAGLRNILAQTMVPLPTVFEGAEQDMPTVPTTELQEAELQDPSYFTDHVSQTSQDCEQVKEIYRWMDESARVLSSSSHNIQSESFVSWSAVSTPVSVRNGHTPGMGAPHPGPKVHCSSLQSSTYSLGVFRNEMRSVLDTITRASSPLQGRSGGAAAVGRAKEIQIKMVALHLSYSFLISHFMVTVYSFSCILYPDMGMFNESRDLPQFAVYLKGCYYASVFFNSGLTPIIFWTFHHKYRQMVTFNAYRLRVYVLILWRKACLGPCQRN